MAPPDFNGKQNYEVDFSDPFEAEWQEVPKKIQDRFSALMLLLEDVGPQLTRPNADKLDEEDSGLTDPRELRLNNPPWRAVYEFDGKTAVMLAIGNKQGLNQDKFYRQILARSKSALDDYKVKKNAKAKESGK